MADKQSLGTVTQPEKQVPVAYDVDVAVAGGGISGVFAAMAAARNGAKTVLVDRMGSLGGNMGPGMISQGGIGNRPKKGTDDWPETSQIQGGMKGLPREFLKRHVELAGDNSDNHVNAVVASYLAQKMIEENGAELMLDTYACDPILHGNRIGGIFVENKSGRQAVKARVVIDATGEADVARRAGGPVIVPGPGYREMDPNHCPYGEGLYYELGGIQFQPLHLGSRFRQVETVDVPEEDVKWVEENVGPVNARHKWLAPFIRKAREAGEFEDLFQQGLFRRDVPGIGPVAVSLRRIEENGTASGATPNMRYDWADGKVVSTLEAVSREMMFELSDFLKKYVPGFENSYLMCIAPYFGARGGPCIEGEHTVTLEDFQEGRRFPDVVYIYGHVSGGRDVTTGDGGWTDYPFRAMIPKKLDGLIASGRSASCVPDTLARGRTKVMHMGQVAGTAAALAAGKGVVPRELDVRLLQRALLKEGFYLGDEARLKELGLA